MKRHIVAAVLAVLALAACGEKKGALAGADRKGGPVVAEGNGIAITAEEFKARLDEQSPFIRARFASLDRKKEFLDNLVRFELLAAEAAKRGLDQDPEVQMMMKRVMVQKLVQKSFSDAETAKTIPDAELEAYYRQHEAEYRRPAKVRVAQIVFKSEAEAKKALPSLRADDRKSPAAFAAAARQHSLDEASKNAGGDLGFRAKDELEAQLSKAAADAAFGLRDGELAGPFAVAQGFAILKRTGFQDALDRPLDAVKPQIANKLAKERRTKEFDDFVKKLKDGAKIQVNDAELEKIVVAAPQPQGVHAMPGAAAPQGAPHP
jgi:peptidyl-prolyl cis-trans isomerase C